MIEEGMNTRIRKSRNAKGYSQKHVAGAVDMPQPSYYKIENGLTVRTSFINEIAATLEVDVNWLLTGESDSNQGTSEAARILPKQANSLPLGGECDIGFPLYPDFIASSDIESGIEFTGTKETFRLPQVFRAG